MQLKILVLISSLVIVSCKEMKSISKSDPALEVKEEISSITEEMGGSNYAFISLGKYAENPSEENWFSDVKTPAIHYHEYTLTVQKQLDFMVKNGQKKIAIPIWFGGSGLNCVTWGHTVCPQNGKVPELIKNNIQNLLKEVVKRNFKEVQIRLGGQGDADVNHWSSFQEEKYQSNKTFIFDVINISNTVLKNSNVQVYYDLGLELMGHPYVVDKPWVKEYLKRIWREYITYYDHTQTIGFSFNHAHREATFESLKIFDESGVRPPRLAFDIYVDRKTHLQNIQWILTLKGWGKEYPIYIQETYRSSNSVASDVKYAIKELGLNIKTIMQWPLDENETGHSNSVEYNFDQYK